MNILTKKAQNILKIALVATLFMLSPFVTAIAESVVANPIPQEYDSMYRYYALESKLTRMDPDDEAEDIIGSPAVTENTEQEVSEKDRVANAIDKQNFYRETILSSIADIRNQARIKSFLVGKSLGNLKFQLVQLKDEDNVLKRISDKTTEVYLQNQIADQISASKEIEIEADNLILEQEGKFSLLGWFVRIL